MTVLLSCARFYPAELQVVRQTVGLTRPLVLFGTNWYSYQFTYTYMWIGMNIKYLCCLFLCSSSHLLIMRSIKSMRHGTGGEYQISRNRHGNTATADWWHALHHSSFSAAEMPLSRASNLCVMASVLCVCMFSWGCLLVQTQPVATPQFRALRAKSSFKWWLKRSERNSLKICFQMFQHRTKQNLTMLFSFFSIANILLHLK